MTKPRSDTQFSDHVARFYDSTLVPLIFEPYARDLATRTCALGPGHVLEVACGTGVVTRELASTLPDTCRIVATDLNAAMVNHAETIGTSRDVRWQQADVMALPYEDQAFDVVLCQFGTMFFPDRVAAYREVRRVLRPAGTFLFNVWKGLEENDFAAVIAKAVGNLHAQDPPRFLARTPYGHGSQEEILSEITEAGFRTCQMTDMDARSVAASPQDPAVAFCHGTPLRNEIEARDPHGLERATSVATEAIRARFGHGPVDGRISAVVVQAEC